MSTATARASSASTDPPLPTTTVPRKIAASERLLAGIAAIAMLAVLIIAVRLDPSPLGHGTHRALGLPPCTWVALTAKPCPTCGMTTAFAHAANGNLVAAFVVQPFGALLALGFAAGVWIAGYVALTGSYALRALARSMGTPALWITLAAMLAAWVYKLLTWNEG